MLGNAVERSGQILSIYVRSRAEACKVQPVNWLPMTSRSGTMLAALRDGAPSRPRLAAALAGLLAGGIGATFYATHCIDDSPLFVAVWYGAGIAIMAALGSVLGGRLLRW